MIIIGSPNRNRIILPNYDTITIGTQVWMKENLDDIFLPNGVEIPVHNDPTIWGSYSNPHSCKIEEISGYAEHKVGRLYNGVSISLINAAYNPLGFRVPTENDFITLINYCGGSSVAAKALKETGTTHWYSQSSGTTNSSGFSAWGTSRRNSGGLIQYLKQRAWYLTSTPGASNTLRSVLFIYISSALAIQDSSVTYGNPIRLIKI